MPLLHFRLKQHLGAIPVADRLPLGCTGKETRLNYSIAGEKINGCPDIWKRLLEISSEQAGEFHAFIW
jgi:hypothetical protein